VLDVAVTEIVLQRLRVDALVHQHVAAGMPQLIPMHQVFEPRGFTEPRDHRPKCAKRERRAALRRKHERRRWMLLALEPAQRRQLSPQQRMRGSRNPDTRRALFDGLTRRSAGRCRAERRLKQ
jgi:hypothetical protein